MQALGIIEVVGMVAGVEAADVACKTADVELVGYELTRGGGYVTVKVLGKVAAATAAIDAAAEATGRITRVVSKLVIPRPHEELGALIHNAETARPVVEVPPTAEPPADAEAAASGRKSSRKRKTDG